MPVLHQKENYTIITKVLLSSGTNLRCSKKENKAYVLVLQLWHCLLLPYGINYVRNIQPQSDSEHKFILTQNIILFFNLHLTPISSNYFVIYDYIRQETKVYSTCELLQYLSFGDSIIRLHKPDTAHFNISCECNYNTINRKNRRNPTVNFLLRRYNFCF